MHIDELPRLPVGAEGEPLATLTQANAEQTHEKNCAKAGN
jgi:hypothetical protein